MSSASEQIPAALHNSVNGFDRERVGETYGWLDQLIRQDGPTVLRLLWRILGREADVMDAYQDCFCKLAQRGRNDDVRNLRAYTMRTASNIAIEMIRARNRRQPHLPKVAAFEEAIRAGAGSPDHAGAKLDNLRSAIAELPDHLRQVVVLRDLSRMSYKEVGSVLRINPATARVYRRHAVVKLAELLSLKGGS